MDLVSYESCTLVSPSFASVTTSLQFRRVMSFDGSKKCGFFVPSLLIVSMCVAEASTAIPAPF